MRFYKLAFVTSAVAIFAIGVTVAAEGEDVPLYTGEDLDSMFGPPPAGPSVPVDKSRPEDWQWVEHFIDREYARIDADRQHDLNRREFDIATRRENQSSEFYGGSLLWGYGGGFAGYGGRIGAVDCNARGYRLAPASVATSMKRAGIPRPSHRRH